MANSTNKTTQIRLVLGVAFSVLGIGTACVVLKGHCDVCRVFLHPNLASWLQGVGTLAAVIVALLIQGRERENILADRSIEDSRKARLLAHSIISEIANWHKNVLKPTAEQILNDDSAKYDESRRKWMQDILNSDVLYPPTKIIESLPQLFLLKELGSEIMFCFDMAYKCLGLANNLDALLVKRDQWGSDQAFPEELRGAANLQRDIYDLHSRLRQHLEPIPKQLDIIIRRPE